MSLIIFVAAAVRANNAINFCITEKLGKKSLSPFRSGPIITWDDKINLAQLPFV